jgi:hypothetical protein
MPKIFEYFGIVFFFYSNEHEPIHVHGNYAGKECKAEIIIVNGKIIKIAIKKVTGKKPLSGQQLKDFELVVKNYADEIVQKWVDYFVLHKDIKFKKIKTKLK